MKKLLSNKWVLIIVVFAVGIFIGKMMGGSSNSDSGMAYDEKMETGQPEIWTCSMHPQIQQDGPGDCPLCGMDLIPLDNSMDSDEALPDEVPMSASAMKLAEIQTMIVKMEKPEKEVRLLGKVQADERLKLSQTVHIPGRIEKLYVNFTGEKVKKGQKIASIYSPELITAQKEFFEVLKEESTNPEFVKAARNKLRQWKLTEEQISELETNKEIITEFEILSDHSGYVMELNVSDGDYVKAGQQLFHIVDLSKVWVLFEAYESDLPWIKRGDKIDIEVRSVPGRKFRGNVTFIDPFINPKTRVAYVRIELANPRTLLKPGMFADGVITSKLGVSKPEILVPRSSILWTGKRAVVYVKLPNREHNSFIYREIIIGEDAGDFYVVKTGLKEGEEIAVNGVFKIDAAAQLSGKKSMMNPTGGKASTGGHAGMDMGDEKGNMKGMDVASTESDIMVDKSKVPTAFKKQLGAAVDQYLLLKDKMVADDNNIKSEVSKLKKALKKVDMALVMEGAHNLWMQSLKGMNKSLDLMVKAVNIDEQRSYFLTLSSSLAEATGKLGVSMEGKQLYLEFCPMANDNSGGCWLSTEEKIRNPSFGKKMMKCGIVKETLTSK